MNTLQGSDVFSLFSSWEPWKEFRKALRSCAFPLAVEGAQGALGAFLAAECAAIPGPILAVVPGQEEAQLLAATSSLSASRPGSSPGGRHSVSTRFRPPPVFSERSSCRAGLLTGKSASSSPRRAFPGRPSAPGGFAAALLFRLEKEWCALGTRERLAARGFLACRGCPCTGNRPPR
jgi:hypothetical protein